MEAQKQAERGKVFVPRIEKKTNSPPDEGGLVIGWGHEQMEVQLFIIGFSYQKVFVDHGIIVHV
jgi:hypothetical protein